MKKKNITRTTSDLKLLIDNNCIYVDKTRYLYELLTDDQVKAFFICRPRRFGKSLACSSLEHILSGDRGLFHDLHIGSNTSYPFPPHNVIHLNFALFYTGDENPLGKSLLDMLRLHLPETGSSPVHTENPLELLDGWLAGLAGKTALIIDEFDAPVTESLKEESRLEEIKSLLSSFYSVIASHMDKIDFLFITGISGKACIPALETFPGLADITFDPRYAGLFGYTEQEVLDFFHDHITDMCLESDTMESEADLMNVLRRDHLGFSFSLRQQLKVFNPIDVAGFFMNGCISRDYWGDTAVPRSAVGLVMEHGLVGCMVNYSILAYA